jgi:uncharacterized protein (TIGR02145 family)
MKAIHLFLLPALAIFACAGLYAQVTIGGLEAPKDGAILDLNSDVRGGLLLSNVSLDNLYTIPYNGTNPFPGVEAGNPEAVKGGCAGAMVYHTGANNIPAGVYLWNGENWSPAGEDCRPLTAADLELTGFPCADLNPPAAFSVLSLSSIRCSEGETFTWSASNMSDESNVTTTLFGESAPSGTAVTANFPSIGNYRVTVTAENRYSTASASKSLDISVSNLVYGIAGPVCLDVKKLKQPSTQSDEAFTARKDAFAIPDDYTKTYKFIHEKSYSALSLTLHDPAGLVASMTNPASDGADPVSDTDREKPFTLTFKPDIKDRVPANGDSLTVKLRADYKNNDGLPLTAYLEIRVEDGTCICPAKTGVNTWLNFMCRNLGAEYDIITSSQLITRAHHGDWYMYGAKLPSMINTVENDSYDNTGWTSKPHEIGSNADWSVANNPCPAGWRLPTKVEWGNVINKDPNYTQGEVDIFPPNNTLEKIPAVWSLSSDEFSPLMKIGDYLYLPTPGYRNLGRGYLEQRGIEGQYWSSNNYTPTQGRTAAFSESPNYLGIGVANKAWGMSVRCVAAE